MKKSPEPKDGIRRIPVWLGVLYGFFPILILCVALMDRRPALYALKGLIVLLYIAAVVSIQLTLGFWPCPHCGKPFFGGWRMPATVKWFSRSNRTCAHCGLAWRDASLSGRAA